MKWTPKSSKVVVILAVAIGLLLIPRPSLAHHNGQAVTDYDYLVCVTGVVTQHEYVNPHALIHVTATDDHGNSEEGIGSGGNPGMETRLGYSAHMFKVGEERITMCGFPQKNGEKRMLYMKLVRTNGEDIPIYQTPKDWFDEFM